MHGQIGITNQSVAPASVATQAAQIFDIINAELVLQETGGIVTADGNEQALYIVNAPFGCFEPRTLFVDLDNMAGGETTIIRVYYRLVAGGGLQLQDYQSYAGADGGLANGKKIVAISLYPNRFGIQITLQQTAGTLRAYTWSVFVEG